MLTFLLGKCITHALNCKVTRASVDPAENKSDCFNTKYKSASTDHVPSMSGLQAFIAIKIYLPSCWENLMIPPQANCYMLSIGVPLLLLRHLDKLLNQFNIKFFNRLLLALSINLRPYQSKPLRWSSFSIIKSNDPFQASYQISSTSFIGRSFNN